ncbi:TIGR02757 family protein [Rubrivirga sp. S365]|uniref:TIGR02757 family protein n=1 Tax=Rubrivirga litoralis TaxID=3075598 RepID=A0ABU3BV42_9BACT|nr:MULTISPECIES: TIGR02757 family protein [unclassified Rubrivirga]MDT0633168.1 TIGR02757 family protein [Rubrivirga sp. F394]MDT7857775.1 TIGR02757 family protein [Rubrivirga sp. S365]
MASPAAPPRPDDLRETLDALVLRYERPAFIADDPVSVPHAFDDPADQEIAGLVAALLAWGRRSTILSKLAEWVERVDGRPHRFVRDFRAGRDAWRLDGFKHRTFSSADAVALTTSLRAVLEAYGSLGALFASGMGGAADVGPGIQRFSDTLLTIVPEAGLRRKHLARPSTGSACKRLAMYARWMTRPGPVDLGLWAGVRADQLVIPLDVHTGRQARRLGLLTRRADDWRAVQELTAACRAFDADDPARYDFALFGVGVYEGGEIG